MSLRALRPLSRALQGCRSLVNPRTPVLAARQAPSAITLSRNFSVSPRRLGSGETDERLSAAIAAEQAYETENSEEDAEAPVFLEAFRANGVWEVQDTPGSDDVVLTRKFGNEDIKLTFQISDLDPSEPSIAEMDDPQPPASASGEVAAEDGDADGDAEPAPVLTASLIISKPSHPTAMSVDMEAGEEGMVVTNVAMFERAVALAEGSEGDWVRRSKYLGPQFEHLDPGVQESFQSYLAERGVDDALAQFILQYAEYKEQKDYVSWLDQIKGFVDQ